MIAMINIVNNSLQWTSQISQIINISKKRSQYFSENTGVYL